ncbi:MAG: AbrB family transcriptional regulator [Rhodobacteraceae bacterium]|nr:AbrB family transcriptional regulator [Paracoccaceae bacterium]
MTPPAERSRRTWPRPLAAAVTLAVAAAGGWGFALLGVPAAWLTGATLAVALAALARMPTVMPPQVRNVVFILLGSSIGANVTPELLARVPEWPTTLLAVGLAVLIVQAVLQLFLTRLCGWDWPTAFFAAVPGLTSYITVVALPTSADMPRVALLQSMRAVLLLLLIPPALELVEGVAPGTVPLPMPLIAGTADTLVTLAVGALGGMLLQGLGVPAGTLVGSMASSTVIHGLGLVEGALPEPLLIAGLIGVGALVGGRFAGYSIRALVAALGVSVTAAMLSFAVAGLCALATTAVSGRPFSELAMAFAPGGIDVMAALAFALNLDSVFVAGHQLVRFAMIVLLVPVVTAAMLRKGYRRQGKP